MLTFINNDSWYSINLKNCRADYKAPCQLCMVDEKVTTWREPPGSLFFIPQLSPPSDELALEPNFRYDSSI